MFSSEIRSEGLAFLRISEETLSQLFLNLHFVQMLSCFFSGFPKKKHDESQEPLKLGRYIDRSVRLLVRYIVRSSLKPVRYIDQPRTPSGLNNVIDAGCQRDYFHCSQGKPEKLAAVKNFFAFQAAMMPAYARTSLRDGNYILLHHAAPANNTPPDPPSRGGNQGGVPLHAGTSTNTRA